MDAHALLTAQGWRGHGHSLHSKDDKIGLSKPLLISRKDNTKGLGVSQHFNPDQWWLNAFDEQLKGLETTKGGGKDGAGPGVRQTISKGKLNTVAPGSLGKYSVYTSFVSGGFLEGTVDLIKKQQQEEASSDKKSKETKEERRARKEAKRQRKADRAVRRAARAERRTAKVERRRVKAEAKAAKAASKKSKSAVDEEKRRRRAKKEEKRRKKDE